MALENTFLAAALLCALAFLWQVRLPQSALRSACKTAAVLLLALAAAQSAAPPLLILALLACAAGDYCLSRDGEGYFMAGIGAFALGHLGYTALFLGQADSAWTRLTTMPQLALMLAMICIGFVMAWLLALRAGALKAPVLCYIPIILGMGVAALCLPGQGPLIWLLPAALSFILSDLLLASEIFLLPKDHPALRVTPYIVWVTYWGAQLGFFVAFA